MEPVALGHRLDRDHVAVGAETAGTTMRVSLLKQQRSSPQTGKQWRWRTEGGIAFLAPLPR
jgi:hypothetical protein